MFIFYIGSGIVITQQRVIVIKSFKPTSFNIDEILYAKVSEKDERAMKDEMAIKDEITKNAITIMDINGRQETLENFPDASKHASTGVRTRVGAFKIAKQSKLNLVYLLL